MLFITRFFIVRYSGVPFQSQVFTKWNQVPLGVGVGIGIGIGIEFLEV
jgi:hypothetical protein